MHRKKITKNTRKDLLIVNMLIYLLSEANSEETKSNPTLLKLHNRSHKINAKIKIINTKMIERLKATIRKVYTFSTNRNEAIKWCDERWQSKEVSRLFESVRETNLEFLANQIIFNNFIERKHSLHKEMEWLTDKDTQQKMFDMLEKTNAESILGTIYYDSLRVVQTLKG